MDVAGLPVTLTVMGGPVSLESNTLTITGTGMVTIKASQAGNKNYEAAADVTQSFMVHKKKLIVQATDLERFYGEPNPALLFTYDGFVLGETEDLLDQRPQAVTTATPASDAGEYPISFTGGVDDNYTFEFVEGKLTIRALSQTIQFAPLANVVFQSSPYLSFALQATASSGLPVTYTVTGPAVLSNGNVLTIIGMGPITVEASQSGNVNYTAATPVIVSFYAATDEKEKGVKPIVRCVVDNGNGTYTARFGYKNDMDMLVYIPFGPNNFTAPGNITGMVNSFQPGNVYEAFTVNFTAGSMVSWSVAGPDGKLRTATAMASSDKCDVGTLKTAAGTMGALQGAPAPGGMLEVTVSPNPADRQVTVRLSNPNAEPLVLQLFSPQGQLLQRHDLGTATNRILPLKLGGYANGIYFIQVQGRSERKLLKIIKGGR